MQDFLKEIDIIIVSLQTGKWEDHSPQMLISSLGKLASYMGNVGGLVSEAEYKYRMLELNHELYEKSQYVKYRHNGKSIEDSKTNAKIDAFAKERDVIEARKEWQDLRSILKAIESLSVACSTTLKHSSIDRANSNFQNN